MKKTCFVPVICLLFISLTFTVHSQNSNAELVHNTPISIDLGRVGGYLEHLPPGYDNDTTRKYPLLVYLHGRGQRGNGSSDLYKISNQARTSPPRHAEVQGSLCFTVNGAEECFILLSPQLSSGNWTAFSQEPFWNYILNDSNYTIGNSAYSNELMVSTTALVVGTPITWTNINGAVQVGDDLVKTARYGWGNSGAESVDSIPSNTDGWVEMVLLDSMKTDLVFGLSVDNINDSLETINYGFQLSRGNGNLWKRENTTRTYLGKFNEGDTLRIERVANTIKYKVNGNVIADTHSASTSGLVADASLLRTGATVFQARIYAGNSGGSSLRISTLKNYFETGHKEEKALLKMYPNPLRLQNELIVFLDEIDFTNKVELVAYDNLGRLVYQKGLDQTVSEIDISHLGGAVYFIKILSNGSRIASGRLLKIDE